MQSPDTQEKRTHSEGRGTLRGGEGREIAEDREESGECGSTSVMSREAAAALMCKLGCLTELLQSRARANVPTALQRHDYHQHQSPHFA